MIASLCLIICGCTIAKPVRFAAIGDTPYFDSDVELLFLSEALEDMAVNKMSFVVHIGDIFGGRTKCQSELYKLRARVFSQSPIPFMITIGDNEFSDCRNSIQARKRFRNIILNNPPNYQVVKGTSAVHKALYVTRQKEMIENASWSDNNVDFIMLVLPDLPGDYPLEKETIRSIMHANISFLVARVKIAISSERQALVVMMHANPLTCIVEGCQEFIDVLFKEIREFGKPVMLINGSDHSRKYTDGGYMDIPNLWHLRPGSEPEISWPEIIYSPETNRFTVKWHKGNLESE